MQVVPVAGRKAKLMTQRVTQPSRERTPSARALDVFAGECILVDNTSEYNSSVNGFFLFIKPRPKKRKKGTSGRLLRRRGGEIHVAEGSRDVKGSIGAS